ncbi:MAG: hypothetical protein F4143_11515 [Gemmatimonadales bacterium]|nr:hypothetical protein [Gemmatimonadales bacterium]
MMQKNPRKPGFQQPDDALTWLERALKMERLKHAAVPVEGDLVPQFVSASAWGYVTAAYMLIEQALKTLLDQTIGFDSGRLPASLRDTHNLKTLFDRLDSDDKKVLEDLYRDYWLTEDAGSRGFALDELGAFLGHLDEGRGSISWRYSLTEEIATIPQLGPVYLEHMWETIRCVVGVTRHHAMGYRPKAHSIVEWEQRRDQYLRWLDSRLNSGEPRQADRIEFLRGPDSRGRSDFGVFRGKNMALKFSNIDAAAKEIGLEVVDMRSAIAAFMRSEVQSSAW